MAGDSISTPLTELLGIRHPILLAPMDGAAGGLLAAEVSAAGAYGQIGGGYCDLAMLRHELELADGARVGIGFITFALDDRPEALDIALESAPPSIQLSFGDPRPYAERIHDAGALLICGVQTPDEVSLALEAGADVIVAQGRDAGGHGRPDLGTMGLIPSVVDRAGSTPVVAAGGIADGRGLAAALMLGASGVTMGTRFLATPEAISNPVEAAELVARSSVETVRTDGYDVVRGPRWPDGHDGRVVRNDFTTTWEAEPTHPQSQVESLRERYKDSRDADYSMRPLWAGEGLDLIISIEPASGVVDAIIAGALDALEGAPRMIRTEV